MKDLRFQSNTIPIVEAKSMMKLKKLRGVGKYKVAKGPSTDGVVYFLRCFWHLLDDSSTNHVIHWDQECKNRFVIPDEKKLNDFLISYDGFRTNMNSFRRSLYFYGFRKVKTYWSHPNLDHTDKESLKNIKRKATSKSKHAKLQEQYMQIMMAQMASMQNSFMKASLPPTNFHIPSSFGSSSNSSGEGSTVPEIAAYPNTSYSNPLEQIGGYDINYDGMAYNNANMYGSSPSLAAPTPDMDIKMELDLSHF